MTQARETIARIIYTREPVFRLACRLRNHNNNNIEQVLYYYYD